MVHTKYTVNQTQRAQKVHTKWTFHNITKALAIVFEIRIL